MAILSRPQCVNHSYLCIICCIKFITYKTENLTFMVKLLRYFLKVKKFWNVTFTPFKVWVLKVWCKLCCHLAHFLQLVLAFSFDFKVWIVPLVIIWIVRFWHECYDEDTWHLNGRGCKKKEYAVWASKSRAAVIICTGGNSVFFLKFKSG